MAKRSQGLFHFRDVCGGVPLIFFHTCRADPDGGGSERALFLIKNGTRFQTSPNIFIISQKERIVNTLRKGCRNFSLFHKNFSKASVKMSIEKGRNICYNKITKQRRYRPMKL